MANVTATTLQSVMRAASQDTRLFVADFMAPRVKPTGYISLAGGKWSFQYYQVGEPVMQGNGTSGYGRAEGAEVQRIGSNFTEATGSANEWALEYVYDISKAEASPTFDKNRVEAEVAGPALADRRMIARDKAVYALLANSGLSGYTIAGSSVGYWDDENVNPLLHISKGFGSILRNGRRLPNRFVLCRQDAISLQNNPFIRSRFGDAVGGVSLLKLAAILSEELGGIIGKEFGVEGGIEVRVAMGVENSATEGQTASNGYIFSSKSWLGYVPPKPGFDVDSGMYQYEILPLTTEYERRGSRRLHAWQVAEVVGEGIPKAANNFVFSGMTQTAVDA